MTDPSAPQTGHLTISGVAKRFDSFKALEDISISVAKGELLTLLGPSGCGKTTLLRTIAGFIAQDTGSISVNGQTIDRMPPHKRNFGMVFQNYAIFPHLSVHDNVAYGLKARRVSASETKRRVAEALERVQLSHLAGRFPDAMSGGQKQRVGLARAMVIEPALLLMDEPLSNLDAKLRISMRQEIRMMQQDLNTTTLYVTHDQEEAMAIADRIAVMNGGRIEQIGTPEEIYDNPRTAFVADFIGGCNWFDAEMRDGQILLDGSTVFSIAESLPLEAQQAGSLTAALRADDFFVATDDTHPQITAEVLLKSYLGRLIRLRVRSANGTEFDADVSSRSPIPSVGQKIALGFEIASLRMFAKSDGRRLI